MLHGRFSSECFIRIRRIIDTSYFVYEVRRIMIRIRILRIVLCTSYVLNSTEWVGTELTRCIPAMCVPSRNVMIWHGSDGIIEDGEDDQGVHVLFVMMLWCHDHRHFLCTA
ncbi:unnamed protein product [Discosporangium mesarthrocarpum]